MGEQADRAVGEWIVDMMLARVRLPWPVRAAKFSPIVWTLFTFGQR
jgi:hypothetical protein